jgi:hypothetical protein
MGVGNEVEQAIFSNAGQAVHVAFLIMAQEATQDAPLRKAIIRVMESIKLDSAQQRGWLDQLRGTGGGTVNFAGLSSDEIRAQCALITQSVKKLPAAEMWVLQAKYGQTEFEDVRDDQVQNELAREALNKAQDAASKIRQRLESARAEQAEARTAYETASPAGHQGALVRFNAAREAVRDTSAALTFAERKVRKAQVDADRMSECSLVDNGPQRDGAHTRRRFAFSPERIAAIQGLSEWFAPMFPKIPMFAIDCMLGRMYANHKKIEISSRDMAANFGGNHTQYLRASWKMKNHLRQLEEQAIERLVPIFIEQGVTCPF